MALDLGDTSLQIERMISELKSRAKDRMDRLEITLKEMYSFDVDFYQKKFNLSKDTFQWTVPMLKDSPSSVFSVTKTPEEYRVLATDGSDIETDRHIPARCYLINIGLASITYGIQSNAVLENKASLYAADEDLVVKDPSSPFRQVYVEGAILAAKRMVEEARTLAELSRQQITDLPTLAIMDGSLSMISLANYGYDDFVRREFLTKGLLEALSTLKELSDKRQFAVASYISLPGSSEVTNAFRIIGCSYDVSECDRYCSEVIPGERPCDKFASGFTDRELFWNTLKPGERSGLFASTSALIQNFYQGNEIYFFYLNTGEEIGRVEIPIWIAEDELKLELVHSLILDQCKLGSGYPVVLREAHELAVITASDRRFFEDEVWSSLDRNELPAYTSEKSRSKRMRWL